MHSELTVRPASESDIPSINALLLEWLDLRKERELVFREAVGNAELIVAEQDGVLVGFIHCVMHNDIIDGGPNCFITAFYVTPGKRRNGIGTRLLRTAVQEGIKKGAVGLEASTTNVEARRLYEKHGFTQFRGEIFLEMDMAKVKEP